MEAASGSDGGDLGGTAKEVGRSTSVRPGVYVAFAVPHATYACTRPRRSIFGLPVLSPYHPIAGLWTTFMVSAQRSGGHRSSRAAQTAACQGFTLVLKSPFRPQLVCVSFVRRWQWTWFTQPFGCRLAWRSARRALETSAQPAPKSTLLAVRQRLVPALARQLWLAVTQHAYCAPFVYVQAVCTS